MKPSKTSRRYATGLAHATKVTAPLWAPFPRKEVIDLIAKAFAAGVAAKARSKKI